MSENRDEFQQKNTSFLTTYPTDDWHKAIYKWPVQLWRMGLGPLMGKIFVLITHTGRKSGLPRRTLTELHLIQGHKYAPSGFGRRSQWYRNIEADPRVTIQTADGSESVIAVRVTDDDEIMALMDSMQNKDGSQIRETYLDSFGIENNREDILAKKDRLYWLRFDPTNEPTPPPLKADLVWIWPLLATLFGGFIWMIIRNRK